MERLPVRQGDVVLVPVSSVPEGAERVRRTRRGIVLAEGESTGHAHCVAEREAVEYVLDGRRYVLATEGVTITHEEHDPVPVPAGAWEVVGQYEHAPQAIQRVAD